MKLLCKKDYEAQIEETRDNRIKWWRDARYGMFVHYGLYSQVGRMEWTMALDGTPIDEYEKLADTFQPRPNVAREWAALAKKAGMKYMVMTTRHHEGFSLWDSKANPYNSVNFGPKRDLVKEFVEACREFDLKIGFYSSLMDWHHPDGWTCAFDTEARQRFTKYIEDINTELLTNYGKIDILWYDVPEPISSTEGWDSLARNQRLRALQPDIIINNRSYLDEDFGTPEEHITASKGDWEACMTFNGISWGYIDSEQAMPYSYNAQGIIRMLYKCVSGGGNLLLNIGPMPDGSVPKEAYAPLESVGKWLNEYGEAVYGTQDRWSAWSSGIGSVSRSENTVYFWNWIWPKENSFPISGFTKKVKNVRFVGSNTPISFSQEGHRLFLKDMPESAKDKYAGIAIIAIEFDEEPELIGNIYYPQLSKGKDLATEYR